MSEKKLISEKIMLETPVRRGETRIDCIQIRRPGSGELRRCKLLDLLQADVASLHMVLPRLTVPILTEDEIKALDVADLFAAGNALGDFFIKKDSEKEAVSPIE